MDKMGENYKVTLKTQNYYLCEINKISKLHSLGKGENIIYSPLYLYIYIYITSKYDLSFFPLEKHLSSG